MFDTLINMMSVFPCKPLIGSFALAVSLVGASTVQAKDCASISALEKYATTKKAPEGATCSTYLTQAAKPGVSCYWEFSFRHKNASVAAMRLWQQLLACRNGQVLSADLPVNHPDSYYLQEMRAGPHVFSVSTKDKASLQRTLVFLRLEK